VFKKRGIIKFCPELVKGISGNLGMVTEDVGHRVGYVMTMNIVNFGFIHGGTVKGIKEMVVVGAIGLP